MAFALLVVVMLALPIRAHTSHAAADPVRNFVDLTYCDEADTSVSVYFAVPGRQQSDQILAERGVFGAIDSVWIDLSLFDNGFTDGTFLGAGPFVPFDSNPGTQFFVWQHLLRARPHFYRLNAYVGTDWIELGRGMFETPDCVVLESMSCPPDELANEVNVRFVMTRDLPLAGSGAVLNWLDLTFFDDGFVPGTFIGAGPFSIATGREFVWIGIRGAARHYYRVNVLYGDGEWRQDGPGSATFLSLDCSGLPKVIAGG